MNLKMRIPGVLIVVLILFGVAVPAFSGGGQESGSAGQGDGASSPFEIVIAFPGSEKKDMQLVEEQINGIIQPEINAVVDFTSIGFASWVQQTNLMLASNEKMDLMWTSSFFNYPSYVARGQVIPLDDLLAEYGQDIQKALGDEILNAARVGGEIYGIPSIRDFAVDFGFVMRADIARENGIDPAAIKTLDDMTAVLAKIKASESDMLPFASTQTATIAELLGQGVFDKLGNWMGVVALNDNKLKVVNFYETEWYAEMLSTLRGWYEAGYLPKDAATTRETPEELARAGKAFSYAYSGKPGIGNQESRKTGKDMVWVPLTPPITTTSSITSGMVSIPVNTENPAKVMELINLWYSNADLVNAFDNGIEGKHYVKVSDTQVNFPDGVDASTTGYTPINFRVGNNFLAYTWAQDPADLWEQTDEFNNSSIKSAALGFSFDATPVKTEVAAVSNVISQYRMGLETGLLNPEQVLPEYIEKLKAAGIDRIIAEKQSQLNDWVEIAK